MKKFTLICLLLLLVTGCKATHKIKCDKELVYECPKMAKTGDTVYFYVVSVTDADVYVHMNGLELKPQSNDGHYEFIMPDSDVEIKVVIKPNGLA